MDTSQILKNLNKIFIEILNNPSIVLTENTSAKDIEEWDSLNNIQIIVAIEKFFNIRFNASDIMGFSNVGEMCEAILKRITK